MLPTATRDVVSFRASVLTAPDLGTSDDVALGLVADVLDKGTASRDRHAFADALAQVQTTLAGLHVVAMATTSGLAARLLVNAERGFDVGYLDRYPDLVRALTPAETTDALRRHVRPADLHITAAGTFPLSP